MPANDQTSMGNIFIALGFCTQKEITAALAEQNGARRLGEVLVARGAISERQLEWAVLYQQMERGEAAPEKVRAFMCAQRDAFFEEARELKHSTGALTARMLKHG